MSSIQPLLPNQQAVITFVRRIAWALVDMPEQVLVEAVSDHHGTTIRLRVDPSDLGKVIGKQGRTARSLRILLGAAGVTTSHRFTLDIEKNEGEQMKQDALDMHPSS